MTIFEFLTRVNNLTKDELWWFHHALLYDDPGAELSEELCQLVTFVKQHFVVNVESGVE